MMGFWDATAAFPAPWTILVTEQGEPQAAFLRGHIPLDRVIPTAEAQIVHACQKISARLAAYALDMLDAAGGAGIRHDWLRMTITERGDDFLEFCAPSARGAFPVTAVRFL